MIILVDSNAICHQAKHSANLDFEGIKTGIIFLFFLKIIKLAKALQSDHFVFCWDSMNSKREEIFPEYKAHRRKERTPEEERIDTGCYKQFNTLKSFILPAIGFESFAFDGYEADDLIASIVKNNEGPFVIVSSDSDLYQLLRDDVSMFMKEGYTIEDFEEEYKIHSTNWRHVKSISGCSTDDIPGIAGVGEKTACKYLRKELAVASRAYQAIVAGKKIIQFNLPLVSLPFEGTPVIKLREQLKLSFDAYVKYCGKYGFNSLLEKENLQSCQKILNLQ